jgi:hypothetical protein
MLKKIREAVWGMFVCIYGCGYSGTYADVQAHQAAEHPYGSR